MIHILGKSVLYAVASAVGIFGGVLGLATAYVEHTGFFGSAVFGYPWLTLAVTAIGIAGALFLWRGKQLGSWLCLAATALGVLPAYTLWEAAGSFFLVAALVGFSNRPEDPRNA